MTDVHNRLVSELNKKAVNKGKLVHELVELLDISQDSVYRRLRGDSEFTLSEIYLMSNEYGLAMDSILNANITSTSFRFNRLYEQTDAFIPYMISLTKQMELLAASKGSLSFIASELPISQSFQNQGLRDFKIYYWQKVVLNRPSLKGVKFDETFGLGININQYADSLMKSYAKMKKIEIWTEETLDDTIRQILYCQDSGLLDSEMIQMVCRSMMDMLNRLENELEIQSDHETSNGLTFYVSSVELGNNVILMDFGSYRTAYVKFNTFNTVSTKSLEFCDEIDLMIKNNLTKSVEISGKSDIHRHKFFTTLRNKVRAHFDVDN
jgi:BetR domain